MYLRTSILLIAAVLITTVSSFGQKQTELKTRMDTISYSIGVNIGKNLKLGDIEIDLDMMKKGFQDVINENQMLTDEEINNAMIMLNQEMQEKMEKKAKAKGQDFLEENKKNDSVNVTESGLQYKVMTEGKGKKPAETDTVKVHYTGKLLDGTIFDSSVERGEPIEFPLNRVIPGWTEGLQLMKEGARYIFYIPYDLAYGAQGAPPNIGPYETLIFDVELIEVKSAKTTGGQE